MEKGKDLLKDWDGFLGLSQFKWNLSFAFLVIFGQVGQNVTLPIWFASAPESDIDPLSILTYCGAAFCLIFFILFLIDLWRGKTSWEHCKQFSAPRHLFKYSAIGVCNGLNGFFLVFAAARTASFLQAILGTFTIFWTIVFRFLILRKLPNLGQAIFAVGVFYGLFLSSVPSIFQLDDSSSFQTEGDGIWKLLWPLIFATSFAPFAMMNVVGEDVLKDVSQQEGYQVLEEEEEQPNRQRASYDKTITEEAKNVNVWYYLFMQSITQGLTFMALFWMDSLPTFGTCPHSMHCIFENLGKNWAWFFGFRSAPISCAIRGWVFIGCYTLNYVGTSLMLRYTEGATWTAVISALVTPLGGIFWLLFEIEGTQLKWNPNFQSSSTYIIVGLIFMSPFIYLYDKEVQTLPPPSKHDNRVGVYEKEDDGHGKIGSIQDFKNPRTVKKNRRPDVEDRPTM